MKTRGISGIAFGTLAALVLSAPGQVLDLQTARTANVAEAAEKAITLGAVVGDVDYFGGRFTFKTSDRVLLMGDVGIADTDDDELALGGGALFQLPVEAPFDAGVKTTFHTTIDGDTDLFDISVLGIFSGDIPNSNGFHWYVNTGLHYVDAETSTGEIRIRGTNVRIAEEVSDDDVVFAIGGGLLFAFTEQVEGYLGIDALIGDIYDDTVFGVGVRWNLP